MRKKIINLLVLFFIMALQANAYNKRGVVHINIHVPAGNESASMKLSILNKVKTVLPNNVNIRYTETTNSINIIINEANSKLDGSNLDGKLLLRQVYKLLTQTGIAHPTATSGSSGSPVISGPRRNDPASSSTQVSPTIDFIYYANQHAVVAVPDPKGKLYSCANFWANFLIGKNMGPEWMSYCSRAIEGQEKYQAIHDSLYNSSIFNAYYNSLESGDQFNVDANLYDMYQFGFPVYVHTIAVKNDGTGYSDENDQIFNDVDAYFKTLYYYPYGSTTKTYLPDSLIDIETQIQAEFYATAKPQDNTKMLSWVKYKSGVPFKDFANFSSYCDGLGTNCVLTNRDNFEITRTPINYKSQNNFYKNNAPVSYFYEDDVKITDLEGVTLLKLKERKTLTIHLTNLAEVGDGSIPVWYGTENYHAMIAEVISWADSNGVSYKKEGNSFVKVEPTATNFSIDNLYPNPASGNTVNMDISSIAEFGNGTLKILDMRGVTLKEESINIPKGSTQTPIDIENIAAGMYMVELNNGAERNTKVFSIVR